MQFKSIALIDGNNLYANAKASGKIVDFRKLSDNCPDDPIRITYYAAVKPNLEHEPLRPMLDWMQFNGFQVVEKVMRESENDGIVRYRGSVITDMIVDLMEVPERIDHVTIFSGDAELIRAIQSLQRRGITVTAICALEMASDNFRRQVDEFIDVNTLDIFRDMPAEVGHIEKVARPRLKLSDKVAR